MKMKEQILSGIQRFIKEKVLPEQEWQKEKKFPVFLLKELCKAGYIGFHFPEKNGGAGLPFSLYCEVIKELTKANSGFGLGVYCHTSLGLTPLVVFGSEEQKKRYLEPGLKAEMKNGDFVLSGSKLFCTNGTFADFVIAGARTKNGISLFVSEKENFTVRQRLKTIGFLCAETAELVFENAVLSSSSLLGAEGKGLKQALTALTEGRVAASYMAVGIAEKALSHAVNYVKTRIQFGRPLFDNQAIQFELAEMKAKLLAAESLAKEAAGARDRGEDATLLASSAKLFATRVCTTLCERALHLHGGYGFLEEYPVSELYRDCKLLEIGEGTSEIHKMVIARYL
jgi:alkylation response protein AidB-like acyl-CoA dehydrogenase